MKVVSLKIKQTTAKLVKQEPASIVSEDLAVVVLEENHLPKFLDLILRAGISLLWMTERKLLVIDVLIQTLIDKKVLVNY